MPRIRAEVLHRFSVDLLVAAGLLPEDATLVAEHLVEANLCGHDSHGVLRLTGYVGQIESGELVPGAQLQVLHETAAVLTCDAHLGFGPVQMRRLIDRLEPKVRDLGVAAGTLRRSGHIGRLGAYAGAPAERGLAAILVSNDNGICRTVAPPATAPRISTNPLSIAVPTAGAPIVLDTSTSVVAHGKVLVRRQENRPCPEGWLQDAEGRPATDPSVLLTDPPGTLLPLGGPAAYKGFGLGVLVDLLAAGLSGGLCPPATPGAVDCNNVLLVALDPAQLAGHDHLFAQALALAEWIKGPPLREGVERIDLPGERSAATRRRRMAEGIELPDKTWRELAELAEQFNVARPADTKT